MAARAKSQVERGFSVSDMLIHTSGAFAGVSMVFAHMRLSLGEFHAAVFKSASALQPGGILLVGKMPSDSYVEAESGYDEARSCVEGSVPFMRDVVLTMMMSAQGQSKFLVSMGGDCVREDRDVSTEGWEVLTGGAAVCPSWEAECEGSSSSTISPGYEGQSGPRGREKLWSCSILVFGW
ncbi:hypothetical protein BKA65DRAFT_163463 [Rhexocercosporidium sp. MPI-PUGE-AT-0058]|nr:hypothetical protein BKA65DRAFT_163463 [Rhexocercosporidium sp. MPI-PUGE-AT-0058]